jgi:hypothetical protein
VGLTGVGVVGIDKTVRCNPVALYGLAPAALLAFTVQKYGWPLTNSFGNVTEHCPVPVGQLAAAAVKIGPIAVTVEPSYRYMV